VDHRDVTFVLAHIGNPWINSAGEVIYKNPNVYGDVSALVIGDSRRVSMSEKMVLEPIKWIAEYVENADKLMFGTDWPSVDQKQYFDLLIKAIPKKDQKKFFHDNAARIFGLSAIELPAR
jgi:predicted TIM-barrel fold metal-dependent hydrolase